MGGSVKGALGALALTVMVLAAPSPAAAHCDSMDGPVVRAAQRALADGDVARALIWVRADDEAEIRAAFARTLAVRKLGGDAQTLADRWFFETLVRIHRAGEGEPFTGLKPAGQAVPAGIAAADRALAQGSVEALSADAAAAVTSSLKERYERVRALLGHDPADVEAGRRYVQAYVAFIHYVEALHALLEGGGEHAAAHTAHGTGGSGAP